MCVGTVRRSLEHLIIPGLVEEGLSNVHERTGVRDERANQTLVLVR